MRGKETIKRLLLSGGLPEDALCDSARVTLTGRTAVSIEGQHGVVELTQERIRLKTGQGVLRVEGSALALHALSPQQAVITGRQVALVAYE